MMPIHVSGEDSIDNSLYLSTESGTGLHKLVQFIQKHLPKAAAETASTVLEEALSLYRGGAYNKAMEAQLTELMEALSGLDNVKGRAFEFYGNRTDLSFFWRKDEAGNRPVLSKTEIESIPNEELRRKVEQTMTKCYIDGVLDLDFQKGTYTITDRGIESIYKADFIENRIGREVRGLEQAEELQQSAARMAERGFAGCNRVTIDIESLGAVETENGLFSRVPNTKGRSYIELQKGSYFPLNEKTVEAYINPTESYMLLDKAGAPQELINGAELSSFYEIKKQARTDIATTPKTELPQAVPQKRAAYKVGDEVWATSQYEAGVRLAPYTVEYAIPDRVSGDIVYKLVPQLPDKPVIYQTESCVGVTMFPDQSTGQFLLADKEYAAAALQMKEKLAASTLGANMAIEPGKQITKAAAQAASKAASTAASYSTPVTAAVNAAAQVAEKTIKSITR